jgi:hypothetical protein
VIISPHIQMELSIPSIFFLAYLTLLLSRYFPLVVFLSSFPFLRCLELSIPWLLERVETRRVTKAQPRHGTFCWWMLPRGGGGARAFRSSSPMSAALNLLRAATMVPYYSSRLAFARNRSRWATSASVYRRGCASSCCHDLLFACCPSCVVLHVAHGSAKGRHLWLDGA